MNAMTIWFIIGAVLMLFELFTPAFITLFFGIGAWAAALVALFYPGLEQELIAFIVVTVASLLFLRKRLIETFQGTKKEKGKNPNTFAPLKRQGEVTKEITPNHEGEIAVGGSFWRASAKQTIAVGSTVIVSGVDENDELLLYVEVSE